MKSKSKKSVVKKNKLKVSCLKFSWEESFGQPDTSDCRDILAEMIESWVLEMFKARRFKADGTYGKIIDRVCAYLKATTTDEVTSLDPTSNIRHDFDIHLFRRSGELAYDFISICALGQRARYIGGDYLTISRNGKVRETQYPTNRVTEYEWPNGVPTT